MLQGLNEADTLACFGDYYREGVLGNRHGNHHQNIKSFIQTGREAVSFEKEALTNK
ncbi:MAG: hypothetical protein ACI815_002018 [Psychroserpens sp.]|jgi:hypothetical protein